MADKNFLNYTGLTYSDILRSIRSKISQDPDLSNINESALAQMLFEIFAGTTDLTNYMLERRAEESFFDTAKLKSSVINLAKGLGYIVQRPIPAQANIQFVISGPLPSGITSGDTFELPKYTTTFTYNGFNYILKDTVKYEFIQSDITNGSSPDFSKTLSYSFSDSNVLNLSASIPTSAALPVKILQGELKEISFDGDINGQTGKTFQKYKITDTKFSNYYGTEDLGYNTSADTYDFDNNLTTVGVGLSGSDTQYKIDRRSLLNIDSLNNFTSAENICLVKSTSDEGVEITFGDGLYAALGPITQNDDIFIQYLATDGKAANQIGVVGDSIQINNTILTSSLVDISNNIEIVLFSNITNGADLESVDSIKLNAPAIYYSLDRLVSQKDYVSYLRTLTSPFLVKNAIAFGENEIGSGSYISQLNNVVVFSVAGALYDITDSSTGTSYVKTVGNAIDSRDINESVLDSIYNPFTSNNSYFNLIVKRSPTSSLKIQDGLAASDDIKIVANKLDVRSQLTVKNVYISPFIQNFNLTGTVVLKSFSDRVSTQRKINNDIYSFLNTNADFNSAIYISSLTEIIENYPQVKYVTNLQMEPVNENSSGLVGLDYDASLASISADEIDDYLNGVNPVETENQIKLKLMQGIANFFSDHAPTNTQLINESNTVWVNIDLYGKTLYKRGGITLFSFYEELIKGMYDKFKTSPTTLPSDDSFANSAYFKSITEKVFNDLSYIIRQNMLNIGGDIVNFSLPNEIALVNLENLIYSYS